MVREFHPVAEMFPLLGAEALAELAADIKKNGLREAILIDSEGRILDGRNRYSACEQAGVEPRFVTWDGEGPLPELALSLNLHRRHLNESQRAMAAARAAKWMETEARERQKRGGRDLGSNLSPGRKGRSGERAGAAVNVSRTSVVHGLKVLRDGCPALIALVDSGELTVSAAARLAKLGWENQALALENRKKGRKAQEQGYPPRGSFGVLGRDPRKDVMLLWLDKRELECAIAALKRNGIQYADRPQQPGEARLAPYRRRRQ